MIPTAWLVKQYSLDAFKNLTYEDIVQLQPGFEIVQNKSNIWLKNPINWTKEFVDLYQTGDEIWSYHVPFVRGQISIGMGLSGFALVRNGQVIHHFTTGV